MLLTSRDVPASRHLRCWLALSGVKPVDVSTQAEGNAAISAGACSINIVASTLALSPGQTFASNTHFKIYSGASSNFSNANQIVSSVGGQVVPAGIRTLTVGGNKAAVTAVTSSANLHAAIRNLRFSTAMSRIVAALFFITDYGIAPVSAQTLNGAGQAGFDALIPQATQAGQNDTVNITIGQTSGNVVLNSNLALPGAAQGIQLNFIADPGTPAGAAQFNVDSGAQFAINGNADVTFAGNGRFNVGLGASARGSVLMSGGTVKLENAGGYSVLNVGFQGIGSFTQTSGSMTVNNSAFQIGVAGGTGEYNMEGGSVTFNPGSTIYVGEGGGSGTVNITGNAQFKTSPPSGSGTQVFIGTDEGTGTVVQNGAGSLVSIDTGSNVFLFGWSATTGVLGGHGSYELRAGTFEVLSSRGVTFGQSAGGTGEFIQSGGNFTAAGPVVIGFNGVGTYELSGGSSIMNGGLRIASGSGAGSVAQTGGSAVVNGGVQFGTGAGTGTYTLSGGTLTVDGIAGGNANSRFIFDGGTLIAAKSFTTSSNFGTIFDQASAIQVNGTDTLTWNSAISGAGTLNKIGDGTLMLRAANSYGGGTTAIGGLINFASASNFGSGLITMNGGGLQWATGTTTDISSRLAPISTGGGTFDTNGNNVTFGSAISGPGALTKTGAGFLTLAGAASYAGATSVDAGTLQAGAANAFSANSAHTIAAGAALDLNSFDQTIGSLAGSGSVSLGAATLTAGSDNTSTTFAGAITGTGGLTKIGAGNFSLTESSTYTGPTNVNGGVLSVDGSLASPVSVNAGGALMGNGTLGGLNVTNGGTVAPGHSIGTLNVAGNVNFGPGSTYAAEFTTTGQSDLIAASGQATLDGATLQVLGSFNPNQKYTILTAQGGVSGTFSTVSTATNFAFLGPSLSYSPTSISFSLEQVRSFTSAATTPNQAAVAGALGTLPVDNPLYQTVMMQTAAGADQAFNVLSGELHSSVQTTMLDDSRYLRQTMLGRLRQAPFADQSGALASLTSGGPMVAYADSAADPASALAYASPAKSSMPRKAPLLAPRQSPDVAWWAQGVGAWGKIDGDTNAAGVNRNLGGFFSGVDRRFGENWRIGIAGGYTNASVKVNARSSSATIDTAHLAGYAGAAYGPWNFRSGAAGSWSTVDATRSIQFPGFTDQAMSRYNAIAAQVFGEVGYGLSFGAIAAEPFAGLAWVHLDTDSFSERGGAAALAGSASRDDVGYSTLGARFASTIGLQDGMTLTPRVSLAWQHAFGDVRPEATLAFQSAGAAFGISGAPLARDAALIESGLDLRITANATLGVSYVGQLASGANDHSVKGGLTWRY